jgi:hypothetical protein
VPSSRGVVLRSDAPRVLRSHLWLARDEWPHETLVQARGFTAFEGGSVRRIPGSWSPVTRRARRRGSRSAGSGRARSG